jgi:hypothetical protein
MLSEDVSTEVITDRASVDPRVLDEYAAAAFRVVQRYGTPIEADRQPTDGVATSDARIETVPVSGDRGRGTLS